MRGLEEQQQYLGTESIISFNSYFYVTGQQANLDGSLKPEQLPVEPSGVPGHRTTKP